MSKRLCHSQFYNQKWQCLTKGFTHIHVTILFKTKYKPMSRSVTVLKTTSFLRDFIGRHSFDFFDGDWNSILTWDRAHRARSKYWSYLTSSHKVSLCVVPARYPRVERKGSVVIRKQVSKNSRSIKYFIPKGMTHSKCAQSSVETSVCNFGKITLVLIWTPHNLCVNFRLNPLKIVWFSLEFCTFFKSASDRLKLV